MKGHKERFIVLSIPSVCLSQSSVDVGKNQPKKSKSETSKQRRGGKHKIKERMRRFITRSFQSFSKFFVYKEEMEEQEREMEIGYPTDVKHLTHIGLDGKVSTTDAPEIISLPSISLKRFELSMSAHSTAHPLALNSKKYRLI